MIRPDAEACRADTCGCPETDCLRDWPRHQPECLDAPIPGRQWFAGCNPDGGYVDPSTGRCNECGEKACPVCGLEECPDHEWLVAA